MKGVRGAALPTLTLLGLLLAWEALVRGAEIPAYTLPAPSLVALTLWQHLGSLAGSWWFTQKITLGALGLACLGGVLVAAGLLALVLPDGARPDSPLAKGETPSPRRPSAGD